MFRRPGAVICFFCQSRITPTTSNFNPRSFRCPECTCWNRYDAQGEIMSDEPAMHDPTLNAGSFAKRASPRMDRIRTDYQRTPFCHACQTNQMLLVNLLGNFLPDPSDPEYERRLAALPEYERSLHARYPPVCANCAVEVEERIEEKDRMARTSALGRLLRQSKTKQSERRVSGSKARREKLPLKLFAWRVRGCLWAATVACSLGLGTYLASGRTIPTQWQASLALLPALMVFSIIWTFWDPTYSRMQKAYLQGRDMRIEGRGQYIGLQAIAWSIRLLSATLLALPYYRPTLDPLLSDHHGSSLRTRIYFTFVSLLELIILAASLSSLRIHRPPQVRLLDTSRSRLSTPTPSSRSPTPHSPTYPSKPSRLPAAPTFDPDSLLAPLTLSHQPIFTASQPAHNPIFGLSSLGGAPSSSSFPHPVSPDAMHVDIPTPTAADDDDAMDWSPSEPAPPPAAAGAAPSFFERVRQAAARTSDEDVWLRPQRFFPPEQPTGLEGLLARTGLADLVGPSAPGAPSASGGAKSGSGAPKWHWGWVYAASVVPLAGVAWQAWASSRRNTVLL